MYQTYETLKHRLARVRDFMNYTQPKDFWIDVNAHLRKLTTPTATPGVAVGVPQTTRM